MALCHILSKFDKCEQKNSNKSDANIHFLMTSGCFFAEKDLLIFLMSRNLFNFFMNSNGGSASKHFSTLSYPYS